MIYSVIKDGDREKTDSDDKTGIDQSNDMEEITSFNRKGDDNPFLLPPEKGYTWTKEQGGGGICRRQLLE